MEKRVISGGAGVPPAGRMEMENRLKLPVFSHNLPSNGAARSRTSGSRAMLFQEVLRHFRGCGILPRRLSKSIARLKAAPPRSASRVASRFS